MMEKTAKTRWEVIEILGDAFIGRGHWEENDDASISGTIAESKAQVMFGIEAEAGYFEKYTAQWKLRADQIAALACYDTVRSDLLVLMRETFEKTLANKNIGRPIKATISFDLIDKNWDIRFAMFVRKDVN